MKKRTFAIVTLLALFIIAAAGLGHAQQSVMVNIPFEFVVGDRTLPAGDYDIQRPATGRPEVLLIHRTDGSASAIVLTMPVEANDWQPESKLLFNRYGDRYFLSQIWTAGERFGRELYKSRAEKELASMETKREVTLVARVSPANR
ncbi:MAG TPA: hypothetical protein VHM88_24370 [Candidatus Acidoferrales bacterium]|nr:hypothetical protein [Candidatus Acidoferrales bacterium]